jgi:hypothetical protein
MRELLYDFNSDKIKPSAQFDLLYLLGLMEDNPEISLELSSHTDTRGVDAYNLDLVSVWEESSRLISGLSSIRPKRYRRSNCAEGFILSLLKS